MIKTLLISIDKALELFMEKNNINSDNSFISFSNSNDPLEIMSHVCSANSSLLILDDDFAKPNSEKLLTSIKKVYPKLSIIFITSNTSLELGRTINSIGVKYYLMKPISDGDLQEYINSIIENLEKQYIN